MPMVAAVIAASAITAGASIYTSNKQEKAIKSAAADADAANRKAIADAQAAKETAAAQAAAQVEAKKRAMASSKTVFTSPLGIGTEASTARKTLLGE